MPHFSEASTSLTSSSSACQNDKPLSTRREFGRNVDPRIQEARKQLPIFTGRQTIIKAVRDNETIVILGETGSGKTTQIPQYIFEAGLNQRRSTAREVESNVIKRQVEMIGITQPRRVAAISLAKRVATEMGVPEPGRDEKRRKGKDKGEDSSLVGYSIRFDDRSGQRTKIKFMTDGWLLREMLSGTRAKCRKRLATESSSDTILGQESNGSIEGQAQYSLLDQYSVLVIDEAHERSVHTDVVLGLVKRIQQERRRLRISWLERFKAGELAIYEKAQEPQELKIIIMSATIDAESFANFFHTPENEPCPVLYVKGRQYPIKLYHSLEVCQNWMESCKKLIVQINDMPPGDVLIFMTGAEEIESLASELQELNKGLQLFAEGMGKSRPMNLVTVKLYAALGGEAIRKCFLPTPPACRKVILATNIAETSITISGIKYVIDCGLAKERTFRTSLSHDAQISAAAVSGASVDMLEIKPISQSAARQRAGRAGRESNGCCFRLYKEDTFNSLQESTLPEILRTDLSSVVLDVFAMGINPIQFDWLDRPEEEGLRAAVVNLVELGALHMAERKTEGLGELMLTSLGREMAMLPLLPQLSKTLLSARDCDDVQILFQALDLVSILSTERKSILVEPTNRNDEDASRRRVESDRARERLSHDSGDHATQLKALYAFRQAQTSTSQKGNGDSPRLANGKLANNRLKDWCSLNYVNLKTVREALRIRSQLYRICVKQGWLLAESTSKTLSQHQDGANDSSQESDGSDSDVTDLKVHRGGGGEKGADAATEGDSKDDYASLRRCLLQGKRVNTAFRQGESNLYQRALGGSERFKIHPSSSLLFRKPLPSVIFFEEIFVSTQMFARTVSAAEASWLTDLSGEVRNRRSLQQLSLQSSQERIPKSN